MFVVEISDTCRGDGMLVSVGRLALNSRPRWVPVPPSSIGKMINGYGRTIYKLAKADVKNTPLSICVIALGEARRIFRGASPRRVRVSHPPVSSLDLNEEWGNP